MSAPPRPTLDRPLALLDLAQTDFRSLIQIAELQAFELGELYGSHAPGTGENEDPAAATADRRPPFPLIWYERPESKDHHSYSDSIRPGEPEYQALTGALCMFRHHPQSTGPLADEKNVGGADSTLVAHLYRELTPESIELVGQRHYHVVTLTIHFDRHGRPFGQRVISPSKESTTLFGEDHAYAWGQNLARSWGRWILDCNRRLRLDNPRRALPDTSSVQRWVLTELRVQEHQATTPLERRLRARLNDADERSPGVLRWMLAHHVQRRRERQDADGTFVPVKAVLAQLKCTDVPSEYQNSSRLAALLTVLGTWRAGRGIYRIDETLLETLYDTDQLEQVPVNLLRQLPEYAVYLPTPGLDLFRGALLNGFFALLDASGAVPELHLVFDAHDRPLLPCVVPLGHGHTLADLKPFLSGYDGQQPVGFMRTLSACINALLYLCSLNGRNDLQRNGTPDAPRGLVIKRVKGGERLFPAEHHTVWDVGIRMGAALRRAYQDQPEQPSDRRGGTPLRPHVRRAHWHTYLTGPRNSKQASETRWMPPIAVNFRLDRDNTDNLPMVVRSVKE